AVVEFTVKVQRIAQIHHYGLKDRPNQHATVVDYPKRRLIGISLKNEKLISVLIIKHLIN
ncbi:phage virion morphogenesis protein, partial [Enterobacter asburiae]